MLGILKYWYIQLNTIKTKIDLLALWQLLMKMGMINKEPCWVQQGIGNISSKSSFCCDCPIISTFNVLFSAINYPLCLQKGTRGKTTSCSEWWLLGGWMLRVQELGDEISCWQKWLVVDLKEVTHTPRKEGTRGRQVPSLTASCHVNLKCASK